MQGASLSLLNAPLFSQRPAAPGMAAGYGSGGSIGKGGYLIAVLSTEGPLSPKRGSFLPLPALSGTHPASATRLAPSRVASATRLAPHMRGRHRTPSCCFMSKYALLYVKHERMPHVNGDSPDQRAHQPHAQGARRRSARTRRLHALASDTQSVGFRRAQRARPARHQDPVRYRRKRGRAQGRGGARAETGGDAKKHEHHG